MGLYERIQCEVGKGCSVLQSDRKTDKTVMVRRKLPTNIIVVHGVNDIGTSYQAVEEGICKGLEKRLKRGFTPGTYRMPVAADIDNVEEDPDAVYFKRAVKPETSSPIIPFYWGYREISEFSKKQNGQLLDRYGNRLDKDLSKGGGPFGNATNTLPDMWNKGCYAPMDVVGDPLRPLRTTPGRLYMVLAAQRLAALISMIRDYAEEDTVSIVAHSQGCLLTLLAQAMLLGRGLRPADTLILTHPPYSLVEDVWFVIDGMEMFKGGEDEVMRPHYSKIGGRQTLHARLQTLVNIVKGVSLSVGGKPVPAFGSLKDEAHRGIVGAGWKAEADRDNRGKVYLYFSPEDMTVALENMRGIGWQGVPDHMSGSAIRDEEKKVFDPGTPQLRSTSALRPKLVPYECSPLKALGPSFYQRVFTAKPRMDVRTGQLGPVLVGQPPHDFQLRTKDERDHDHVEASGRSLRAHLELAPGDNANSNPAESRTGIRTITGEPLPEAVVADLLGEHVTPSDIPRTSTHYGLKKAAQGPCEAVDPIDAAIATSARTLVTKMQRPDPSGCVHYPAAPQDLTSELQKMTDEYNREKHPLASKPDELARVIRATRYPDGKVIAEIQQSANDMRLHWQHEVSAKSFHGAIIGSAKNHAQVTSYDVAIGSAKASSDPYFYAYLCAVADWRLKNAESAKKLRRKGIPTWDTFHSKFSNYWNIEPEWRRQTIEGNSDYYSSGVLPECIPLLHDPVWTIVVSETTDNRKIIPRNK